MAFINTLLDRCGHAASPPAQAQNQANLQHRQTCAQVKMLNHVLAAILRLQCTAVWQTHWSSQQLEEALKSSPSSQVLGPSCLLLLKWHVHELLLNDRCRIGAVYGVLPISCIFLVLYSYATQRFSRATLFNIVVSTFLALYTGFALLYPHHETMHFHGFASHMLESSPAGLAGAIGMVRNWMFTLFYCTSELWGDVVLSLLFW